ncbi:CGNR zinc finger domain-containing protein [Candidatus Methylomirabilis sp.]|uniref:CGNR zinc finger domain-containing protein n=1 Tax=Candidatus Methylomirabilis sp. TaxID=2032687 RepID=UPI003076272C
MQTAKDRLEFVLRFVNADLDHLRPGDWLNLKEDFALFLGCRGGAPVALVGPIRAMPIEPPFPQDMAPGDFKTLQSDNREILTQFVKVRERKESQQKQTPLSIRASLMPLDVLSPRFAGRAMLQLTGPTRDMFLTMVFLLFAFESTARIAACPECERLMLRTKKREYCSPRCQTRAYMRRYRQRETVKQQEAEQAHTRYANKRKRQLSEKVHVARRPRKEGKNQ